MPETRIEALQRLVTEVAMDIRRTNLGWKAEMAGLGEEYYKLKDENEQLLEQVKNLEAEVKGLDDALADACDQQG